MVKMRLLMEGKSIMDYGENGSTEGDKAIPDTSDANLDRSKVHVLLCDKDPDSSLHVMKLLQQCLYQVTCVKSAGQVLEVLRSCSYEVDLILSEVELPKEKGLKMLKHIVRKEQLHRIPIVIMSTRDEMGLIVKCLSLGAVDYLLKPLRMNELLNLWTHTWRRRRMLGLSEKHSLNKKLRIPFDLIVSETSESNNTNGTNILSDDMDDLKYFDDEPARNFVPCRIEPEGNPQLELSLRISLDMSNPEVSSSKEALVASCPKKTELKIARSSAFLSYAKVNEIANTRQTPIPCEMESDTEKLSTRKIRDCDSTNGNPRAEVIQVPPCQVTQSRNFEKLPIEVQSTNTSYFSINDDLRSRNDSDQIENSGSFAQFNDSHMKAPSFHLLTHVDGGITAMPSLSPMLPPTLQMHHGFTRENSVNVVTGIPLMQPPNLGQPGPTTPYLFPYYTHTANMAAPQLGSFNGWLPATNHIINTTSTTTVVGHQFCRSERREAALDKFRRKRKDRCFDKKIRYVSRKKLAEQRPRIKGQFVKRGNGKDNINDSSGAFEEYEEGDDDEQGFEEQNVGSSPESVAEDP